MKEQIINAIKLQNGKITFKNLSKKFKIDTIELKNILLELKLDGKILQIGNKYMIFHDDLKLGTIIATTSGNKYIYYDGERIPISSDFLNDIILNDVVSFKYIEDDLEDDSLNNKSQVKKAQIVSIVDRPLSKMTCTVMNVNGKKKLVPYRNGINITLPVDVMKDLFEGDIILVDITPNEIGEYCDATFIKKIGRVDDPSKEDEATALNYGFSNEYSDEYMEEIAKYPTSVSKEETIGRKDFRYQKSCTIDGIYTKDMDDGVFAEVIENGIIRVYVHIADVSHYVKHDSLVFKRACKTTTSLYTNNAVFHMLHHIISNGICSLNPNEDRLTKTVIMDVNKDGEIVNVDIVKSVINSKKKMTYEDVDKIFVDNEIPQGYEDFIHELMILREASTRLENRYTKNGKITFANNETKKTYNSDGTISEVRYSEDTPARKIIEYLMIGANESVANWLYNIGIPAIYRILEQPDINKINAIIDKLNKSGFNIRHVTNVDSPKNIQRILDRIQNSKQFPLVSQMLVMGMQRARYSIRNLGHYALCLDYYTHFTSPIRRLADLLVHMLIDLVLEDYDKLLETDLVELEKLLEELCVHASRMERQADMAEADCERRAIIKHMEGYIGCDFEAIVCEIDKRIRIKLNGIDTYIDNTGFSDNFEFDRKKKMFYEISTGKYIKFGTKVLVRLMDANSANRTFRVQVLETVCEKEYENNVKKKILA